MSGGGTALASGSSSAGAGASGSGLAGSLGFFSSKRNESINATINRTMNIAATAARSEYGLGSMVFMYENISSIIM